MTLVYTSVQSLFVQSSVLWMTPPPTIHFNIISVLNFRYQFPIPVWQCEFVYSDKHPPTSSGFCDSDDITLQVMRTEASYLPECDALSLDGWFPMFYRSLMLSY